MLSMLTSVSVSVGVGFGLFAIFSVLRYRTDELPIREMTYLFTIIALPVSTRCWPPATIWLRSYLPTPLSFWSSLSWKRAGAWFQSSQRIIYEKIELITPERRPELLADLVPTRGLLGFRYQFLTATRGMGVMNALFHDYLPYVGEIPACVSGSLVASDPGEATTFGLKNAEERGMLFVTPGDTVYEGMVVGENSRPVDISVNVVKRKHLTNMRESTRDIEVRLKAPRQMRLDEAVEYLSEDELLEVTPESYRIRKAILDTHERGKERKRTLAAQA